MEFFKELVTGGFTPRGVNKARHMPVWGVILAFIASSWLLGLALGRGVFSTDPVGMLRWLFPEAAGEEMYYWNDTVRGGIVYRQSVISATEAGNEAIIFAPGNMDVSSIVKNYHKSVEIHDGYAVIHYYGMSFKGDIETDIYTQLVNGKSTMSTLYTIIWPAEVSLYAALRVAAFPLAIVLNAILCVVMTIIAGAFGGLVGEKLTVKKALATTMAATVVPSVIVVVGAYFTRLAFVFMIYAVSLMLWCVICMYFGAEDTPPIENGVSAA